MKLRKIISLLLCLIMVMVIPIPVSANECSYNLDNDVSIKVIIVGKDEMREVLNNSIFLETIDLGNGFECSVYEEWRTTSFSTNTITKTHDFFLSCNGTNFGYLRQTTSWSYDGTNRPTCLSSSNTFYSTDTSKNYLSGQGSTIAAHGSSSTIYTRIADVYYNTKYIATTEFSTICDKNGNLSFSCTDV